MECPKQKNSQGIAQPVGQRILTLPADPLCVWERDLSELAHCLNSAFSKQAPFRDSSDPVVYLSVRGNWFQIWNLEACFLRRRTWVITLPHWLNYCTERRVIFILLFSVLFGAMFSDRLESRERVCLYVWVCIYRCVGVLPWRKAPPFFFSNTEMWRQPKIFLLTCSHAGA